MDSNRFTPGRPQIICHHSGLKGIVSRIIRCDLICQNGRGPGWIQVKHSSGDPCFSFLKHLYLNHLHHLRIRHPDREIASGHQVLQLFRCQGHPLRSGDLDLRRRSRDLRRHTHRQITDIQRG